MLRTWHFLTSLILLGLVAAGCGGFEQTHSASSAALAGHYTIKGGGSALSAVKTLTDAFTKTNPRVTFDLEDIGSDGGIALTAQGAVDLGMISRELKATEQGQVETLLVGGTATGIVVRADNPVQGLTRAQVRDIFAGAVTDWAQVGGQSGKISVFIREPESSTRSNFESFVFGKDAQYAADAVEVYELNPMLNGVSGLRGSVGMATVDRRGMSDASVRFLTVDGVAPTADTIKSGSYPIRRPLYVTYRTAGVQPAVQAFLDFVQGPEGQRLTASL